MIRDIIEILFYFFEAFFFWFFCDRAFKKTNRWLSLFVIFVSYFVLSLINRLHINYINILASTLVYFLIMWLLHKENPFVAITYATLFEGAITASEYIAIPLLAAILRQDFYRYLTDNWFLLIANVISKSIHFLSMIIYLKIYQKHRDSTVRKGYPFVLIISISNMSLFLLIQYISGTLEYSAKLYVIWIISALFFFISSFLVLYYRDYIIGQAEKINDLNIENQKKELDHQYFSIIEKSNQDMRILAHDFKNHLVHVRSLDQVEEKDAYIDKIIPRIDSFSKTGISKNKTLDLIINKYSSLCDIKGVRFNVDVKTSNLSQIDNFDLVSILNNLLDNAVCAAEDSEEKEITFCVESNTQFLDQLTIQNSCSTVPIEIDGKLVSAKKDSVSHGLGLKSVERTIKKYNGIYYWEYDADQKLFTTIVTIPK